MTPRLRLLAAAFLGAILSLTLHGCNEAVKETLHGYVQSTCKVLIEDIKVKAEEKYLQFVAEQCKALRDKAHEQVLNVNRSDDLEKKCLDKAGGLVADDSEAQETNYTAQCVAKLSNATDEGWSGLQKLVLELSEEDNWKPHLDSLLNSDVLKNLDEFAKENGINVTQIGGSDSKSANEDTVTSKPTADAKEKTDTVTSEPTTDAPKADAKKSASRLFDSSVDIPRPVGVHGVAVVGLIGVSMMVAFGVAVRLRQGMRHRSELDHLVGEGSEPEDA